MNKEELHNIVVEQQPNKCQIAYYTNNKNIYSDVWNNYKEDDD